MKHLHRDDRPTLDTPNHVADPVERCDVVEEERVLVHGWKMENGRLITFVVPRTACSGSSLRSEVRRIGEKGLADWQPHITRVVVEKRYVTPWRKTYDTDVEPLRSRFA